jgi:transposase
LHEYIYLYGAVTPEDGTCVYLITSNTACFQSFLNVLSRRFARQDILLVLDGAPNHRCSDLAVPDNITLLFLPPYAPQLNPKENLRDEIREKIFKNYALKSIDAVYHKLDEAILYIERNPEIVKSITSFPYIANSL